MTIVVDLDTNKNRRNNDNSMELFMSSFEFCNLAVQQIHIDKNKY